MKKTLLLLAVALFASCEKNNPQLKDEEVSSTSTSVMAAGMGAYDVLGHGYDVTGQYAEASSAGFKVIDVEKLKLASANRVIDERPLGQEYVEEYGENAEQYSKMVSNKVSATASYKMFGASISTSFSYSNEQSSSFDAKYIYGSYRLTIKQKRYRINSDVATLRSYLTPEFIQDIQIKSVDQIIRDYGTHVMLDIYTGGKLDMKYQSETSNQNRTEAARIGIKVGAKAVFEAEAETASSVDIKASNQNFSRKLSYKSLGGDPTKSLRGEINLDTSLPKINLAAWQSSVTTTNSVLIDFGYNGLMPIYELVSDASKRNALMIAVNQYIANGGVKNYYSVIPIYSIYIAGGGKNEDHLLTASPQSETAGTNEGIMFNAYGYKRPGAVPVYRYYNGSIRNHLYTIDPAQESLNGYTLENVAFYAFPNVASAVGEPVKAVYRYWSLQYADHYLTPTQRTYPRYQLEGVGFYVPQ